MSGPFGVIGIVAVVVALFGAFGYGKHVANAECAADQLKMAQAADIERQRVQKKLTDVSKRYEVLKRKRSNHTTIIREEVERIVEAPIYRNVCFDTWGVQIVNDAIRGSADPASVAPALPPNDAPR